MDAMMESLPIVKNMMKALFPGDKGTRSKFWGIELILWRNFFSRVWIILELSSAQDAVLMDGNQEIPLKQFFIVWAVLYHYVGYSGLVLHDDPESWVDAAVERQVKRIAPLLLGSHVLKSRKRRTLFELLRACGDFDATDPRDKVYALLGIAEDADRLGISADYSKSPTILFTQVAEALLRKYGVNILSFNEGLPLRGHTKATLLKRAELPTWCPDGTIPAQYTLVSERTASSGRFSSRRDCQLDQNITFQSGSLWAVHGFCIGAVSATGTRFNEDIEVLEEQGEWVSTEVKRKGLPGATRRLFRDIIQLAKGLEYNAQHALNLGDAEFAIPIAYQFPIDSLECDSSSPELWDMIEAYQYLSKDLEGLEDAIEHDWYEKVRPYLSASQIWASVKAVFRYGSEYLGLAHWTVQQGDIVVILLGGDVPYTLRPFDHGHYELLGEAYVYGIMHGEFLRNRGERNHLVFSLE
jgi:hypothetical protein